MGVRKNFIFDEETARHLEEIARFQRKTQTQILQESIQKIYAEIERRKKLSALEEAAGSLTGKIGSPDAEKVRSEEASRKYG
ncbi:hypothetical protein [Nitratifractor sp.]